MNIMNRKDEHIVISLNQNVESISSTWFECVHLVHEAIPEINIADIDTSTSFLKKKLNFPFIFGALTGGTDKALKINETLATVASNLDLAMMVGSQRVTLEHPKTIESFSIVRKCAPDIPIIANIGISQILKMNDIEVIDKIVSMIEADGIAIHLNVLQECIQSEEILNFNNAINKIQDISDKLSLPLIIKETGSGISRETAEKLNSLNYYALDVAGVGGTSFSLIENIRLNKKSNDYLDFNNKIFENWGIPTAASIIEVKSVLKSNIKIIGSGGIRSGLDIAKSISLGSDYASSALPLLRYGAKGINKLETYIQKLKKELEISMFLTGCKKIEDIKKQKKVLLSPLREWLIQRNLL